MADRPRTGFAPIVALGVASAALSSVASAKPWFRAAVSPGLMPGVSTADRSADMPLALALSLVVLAGWGVLLVTRGRVRRLVAAVAALAALAVCACGVVAPFTLPDQIRGRLLGGTSHAAVSPTGWYVTAAAAAVLGVLALALAWLRSPTWPTMSSRYDAPATARSTDAPTEPAQLWKALDEGVDPTEPDDPRASGGSSSP